MAAIEEESLPVGCGWRLPPAGKFAVSSALVLLLIALSALLAPVIAPHDPIAISSHTLSPPSLQYPFGTDQFGRDMFSRVLWGGRLTLSAAALSVLLSMILGIPLGLIAGYSAPCWVATGLSGHGFMMAPAVGRAVADMMCGAEPAWYFRGLGPDRFAEATLAVERQVI
jgi:peptide/nickel transport system permease protein